MAVVWTPARRAPRGGAKMVDDGAGGVPGVVSTAPGGDASSPPVGVTSADFYAYLPGHQYIFVPTRALWPGSSVDSRLGKVRDGPGGPAMRATTWLDTRRAVEQMTWAPGLPMVVDDRLMADGGWIDRPGCRCFNLYRPPAATPGDPALADPWLDHVTRVYPDDAEHVVRWLAQRVQAPDVKINHALVLGGDQGIGKDTILEPIKVAVGPWNFSEVSPVQLLGRFNGFLKSVILRVSEARDLGDVNRYSFYDHLKTLTAAPPDVLRVDEKNLREYAIPNVTGVVITTNYKATGLYLPFDDRRHYVAWSNAKRTDFSDGYWRQFYRWYARGGIGHVVAYLKAVDLTGFDPKAPPQQTQAFFDIASANTADDGSDLGDLVEALGRPDALTASDLLRVASPEVTTWLSDRRNSRVLNDKLDRVGYTPVRSPAREDGRWRVNGSLYVIYARKDVSVRERHLFANKLQTK